MLSSRTSYCKMRCFSIVSSSHISESTAPVSPRSPIPEQWRDDHRNVARLSAIASRAFHPFSTKGRSASVTGLFRPATLHVDVLHRTLQDRLSVHITRTLSSEAHHRHYVWAFARTNMMPIAVAMIHAGHVRSRAALERELGNPDFCLLANQACFHPLISNRLQGCYLMYHEDLGFFRSGKVANRPFKRRLKEHRRKGYVVTAEPSIATGRRVRLLLEDVKFFTGLAFTFDKPDAALARVIKDIQLGRGVGGRTKKSISDYGPHRQLLASDESGLFVWQEHRMSNESERQGTRCDYIAYLCELAYALSLGTNRFTYPGFEGPLGLFEN